MKKLWINEIKDKTGETVELFGWVNVRRDHGKIIFIDLRDRSGIAQLVFVPQNKELYKIAETLRPEWVLFVKGEVVKRPKGMENPELETGKVEVKVAEMYVLSKSETPPFPLDDSGYGIDEELRLKYRYLDLRRVRLKNNLILRHKVVKFIRDYLSDRGFIEIETPILTKSTPEGARDYVVPSRLHPGKFYALPQSPQQYKQLLMVAGVEKYFQIARALRDEDTRGDRQPEHTQLDLEMSFAEREDILQLIEELYIRITEEVAFKKVLTKPFPRLTHQEAIERFGKEKFDLRDAPDPDTMAYAWVIDFPLFEKTPTQPIAPSHHPFTAPRAEDIPFLDSDPFKVRSWQYDLVLNGSEIGGGSIRITDPELQKKIFRILGYKDAEMEVKFGHLLEAYTYGAPPHGGIALGIDRLVAVLQNEPSIREAIAFPKTGDARDPMMDIPSEIDKAQLKELHLEIKKKK